MPRKHKHTTLTERDIRNLRNISPASVMIMMGIVAGGVVFIIGIIFVVIFANVLQSVFSFSNEITFFATVSAILALVALTVAVIIGMSIFLITEYKKAREKKYRGMKIANIDAMSGIEFEQYLKQVLTYKGYSVSMTRVTGDLGVDLVALGNGKKFAIQAKRYHNKVSRHAISDAVAGMYHYGCNKAMVITNNYYSPGAVALAKSTGCILIDRDTLAIWINEFQSANAQNLGGTTGGQMSTP